MNARNASDERAIERPPSDEPPTPRRPLPNQRPGQRYARLPARRERFASRTSPRITRERPSRVASTSRPPVEVQNGRVGRAVADLDEVLDGLVTGAGRVQPVRPEIAESWRRVAAGGLRPDRFDPMYDHDVERDGRLERAAAPVLGQLIDDLAGTESSLVLTDERGHVVARRVSEPQFLARLDEIRLAPGFFYDEADAGTNGIGSALAQGRAFFVHGREHFADLLTGMACAGVPVTDPRTGLILGVVDVTVSAENASPLMLPLAKRAAWEIEQRLLEGASAIEWVLHDRFVHARRAKRPVVLVSEYTMMANPAATGVVDLLDRPRLWEWARRMIENRGRSQDIVFSTDVSVTGCEPVHAGGALIGALVWLDVAETGDPAGSPASRSGRPAIGWGALTDSERGVADLVAYGMTNRQVAERLFVSPHTVDAHLRHIFNKLGIRSRVELARLVAEHPGEQRQLTQ
jgi:DNA-binding CsgD family transcriptional regulator